MNSTLLASDNLSIYNKPVFSVNSKTDAASLKKIQCGESATNMYTNQTTS